MNKLPIRISTRMDVETTCNICLTAFKQGETMRVLPCQHEFHQDCIDRWLLESKRTCPCCRLDVCAKNVDSCCVLTKTNLIPGLTVVRGPDWIWDDQDGGPGETGKLMVLSGDHSNWATVTWANAVGNYRISGAADLKYVKSECACGKGLATLSAKQLRRILMHNGVSAEYCIEKSEFLAKVRLFYDVMRVGARVEIHNMARDVRYNGMVGTVRSVLRGGRIGVEVKEEGHMISIKLENLRPL